MSCSAVRQRKCVMRIGLSLSVPFVTSFLLLTTCYSFSGRVLQLANTMNASQDEMRTAEITKVAEQYEQLKAQINIAVGAVEAPMDDHGDAIGDMA